MPKQLKLWFHAMQLKSQLRASNSRLNRLLALKAHTTEANADFIDLNMTNAHSPGPRANKSHAHIQDIRTCSKAPWPRRSLSAHSQD